MKLSRVRSPVNQQDVLRRLAVRGGAAARARPLRRQRRRQPVRAGGRAAHRRARRHLRPPLSLRLVAGRGRRALRRADPTRFRILGIDFIADEPAAARRPPPTRPPSSRAVLDVIGVERALAFVGASYGGMIALAFGQHFPDRVERLVVVSAGAGAAPDRDRGRASCSAASSRSGSRTGGATRRSASPAASPCSPTARPTNSPSASTAASRRRTCSDCSAPGAYLRARGDAFRQVMSPERFLSLSASIDRHRVEPAAIRRADAADRRRDATSSSRRAQLQALAARPRRAGDARIAALALRPRHVPEGRRRACRH